VWVSEVCTRARGLTEAESTVSVRPGWTHGQSINHAARRRRPRRRRDDVFVRWRHFRSTFAADDALHPLVVRSQWRYFTLQHIIIPLGTALGSRPVEVRHYWEIIMGLRVIQFSAVRSVAITVYTWRSVCRSSRSRPPHV